MNYQNHLLKRIKKNLYNINENKFVDFSNNEYINYPNLPESIIKNIDEYHRRN